MRFSGAALYQRRLKKDMSRADLASAIRRASGDTIKATERGIRGWEKGEYVPRGDAVPALAAALGVKVDELYSDEEEEESRSVSDLSHDEWAMYGRLSARAVASLHRAPREASAQQKAAA